ncbi:MBL fold metallo-hydrolase [Desulfoluna sp.]|uniref:MBL fold metallo-hydrolase n=1 Tax=Desulfoluna sp. TaxID=2045199 RepID=UPI003457CE21
MASHMYFLEEGDEVILFDPSCGKGIAKRVEAHIRRRKKGQVKWKKAFLIAGHSHMDHANNFFLSDVIGAPETHIYLHEEGFQGGEVKNKPAPFIENMFAESSKYFNPYLAFSFPYNVLMFFLAGLDALSPRMTRKLLGVVGSLSWPDPVNGSVEPEPLRQDDLQIMNLGGVTVRGWRVGHKILLPTPGHSTCSVSLFWPEQKALFVSDADWIGNPVFVSGSLKDCLHSLEMLKALCRAEQVDTLLPAHGLVKQGREEILSYLDFHIRRLEVMRNEVLAAYRLSGEDKDVRRLTRLLIQESPLFRMLKLVNYPRQVVFVHHVVAVCLREEGLLD